MQKLLGTLLIVFLLVSCGKESATVETERPADYLQLQPGRYIIYQLDSLVKTLGNDTAMETHSYQAKDLVDALITDNLGRPSWRIFRFLRPLDSQNESDWAPSDTYMITPTSGSLEWIENNQRFLKLVSPIETGDAWMGNRYINTTPGGPLDYLQAWEYQYTDVHHAFSSFENTLDSCITVVETDEGNNYFDDRNPVDPDLDGYRIYSISVYAKNIGLVYRDFVQWDFEKRTLSENGQPTLPTPVGSRTGFGVRLRMISYH